MADGLGVAGLSVAIGPVQVLRDVSFDLPRGTMMGLIGRNGAGKTTLMRAIMGLLKPSAGRISFDGADLIAMPAHQRAHAGIGYMPEDRRLIPELTVEENILLPGWATNITDGATRLNRVFEIIPELKQFGARKALQLSGGQQKLVALGRAMLCGTRLLLLDEPFEGVAPALAQRLVEVVAGLKATGLTVILSESDFQHSERIVDRVTTIDRGVISAAAGFTPV